MFARMTSWAKSLLPHREASRQTAPALPASGYRYLVSPISGAGIPVTEQDIFRISTATACVRYIAESLAAVDLPTYRRLSDGGKERQPTHRVDRLFNRMANPEMTSQVWREVTLAHALISKGAFSEIERDPLGRPVALWPLAPARVFPLRTDAGRLVYRVTNMVGPATVLDREDVFHIRGLSWDGILGYELARIANESLGLTLAAEKFAALFFGNGATPSGILTTDQVLGEDTAKRLKADWQAAHAGPSRQRGLAVMEQGLKFQETSTDPEAGQLVGSRQHQVEDIARWFRVPPHKIGHLLHSSTRANVEQQSTEAIQDCLMPWAKRLECEINTKLIPESQQNDLFTRHDFLPMMRGDMATMTLFLQAMIDRAILDVDEAREMLDRNPLGEAKGGKKRFFPLNFTTLERAGEEPLVVAKPGGASSGNSPGTGRDNRLEMFPVNGNGHGRLP